MAQWFKASILHSKGYQLRPQVMLISWTQPRYKDPVAYMSTDECSDNNAK